MFLLTLSLVEPPYFFPTLIEEEKQSIEVILGRRSNLKKVDLKVVKHLNMLLTIPSDIFIMYYKSYNCYLVITRQIALYVRNSLI